MRTEIEDLLAKGYVDEVPNAAFCCNPLTVVSGHKMRMVLDLRYVNPHVAFV